MKTLYLDRTGNRCIGISAKDINIVNAGTTIYAMPISDKNKEYNKIADKYDIHFIFDDNVPKIDFYTIPQVDIMATDSNGGYIGTIGQISDLESNAPICYIDKNRKCYLIAENGKMFLNVLSIWKTCLKEYNHITFYKSIDHAKQKVEFIDIPDIAENL